MFAIILIFFIFRLTPKINIVWYYGVQNLMMYFALLLSIISGVNYGFNFTKGKLNE
jgi:hypothetical protein